MTVYILSLDFSLSPTYVGDKVLKLPFDPLNTQVSALRFLVIGSACARFTYLSLYQSMWLMFFLVSKSMKQLIHAVELHVLQHADEALRDVLTPDCACCSGLILASTAPGDIPAAVQITSTTLPGSSAGNATGKSSFCQCAALCSALSL